MSTLVPMCSSASSRLRARSFAYRSNKGSAAAKREPKTRRSGAARSAPPTATLRRRGAAAGAPLRARARTSGGARTALAIAVAAAAACAVARTGGRSNATVQARIAPAANSPWRTRESRHTTRSPSAAATASGATG
jgi:hypothetical protein